ncbi:hypothetical protein OF387_04150 [Lentilactobacillus hilgardii]|nr:hypothetical protein [Lentilactobacillus hilgardii]MCV3740416.1 hypothetical protein [Lentilactobacillus hilgardii]
MQSNQSYLTEIRDTVKNNYRRFFAIDSTKPTYNDLPQMPEFQIQLFLNQTLKTGFPIKIQFNNQSPAMSGKLTKLSNERYLLTNQQHNMTRIVNILEIRSIQKIK